MSANQPDRDELDPVQDAALRHFARERSGDMTARDAAETDAWLAAGDDHAACYDEVRQLWADLDELRSDPAILAMREDALARVARRRRWRFALQSVAAAILVTISLGGSWWAYNHVGTAPDAQVQAQRYATRTGELASVALADGSLAVLDSNSAIRSRIGANGVRRVELLSGRALFAVAKNPQRRFTVEAGNTFITALGTRFDVYRRPHGLEVNLVEGRLRVEPRPQQAAQVVAGDRAVEMIAGDRLVVGRGGLHLMKGMAEREIDWAKGQLVFDDAPIDTVVDELNRYSTRKITLTGTPAHMPHISAVIRTSDPLMFLRAVETMGIGRSRDTGTGYEILLR